MTIDDKKCNNGKNNPQRTCWACEKEAPLIYWCETCQHLLPGKRCPDCGLKARKVRQSGHI
ncbi:MAG: hypothetical protein PHH28_15205 [Desulfuromonadaceae bacterium]|nr:hypothetical protein [Desulfuromonadaceae bacterium]